MKAFVSLGTRNLYSITVAGSLVGPLLTRVTVKLVAAESGAETKLIVGVLVISRIEKRTISPIIVHTSTQCIINTAN